MGRSTHTIAACQMHCGSLRLLVLDVDIDIGEQQRTERIELAISSGLEQSVVDDARRVVSTTTRNNQQHDRGAASGHAVVTNLRAAPGLARD